MGRRHRRVKQENLTSCECPIKVDAVRVEDTCLVELCESFFLLVELESNVPNVVLDTIVAISISKEQFKRFCKAGVKRCTIVDEEPIFGRNCPMAEFRCILILDGQAFRVFTVVNSHQEEIILVPAPLCNTSQECC